MKLFKILYSITIATNLLIASVHQTPEEYLSSQNGTNTKAKAWEPVSVNEQMPVKTTTQPILSFEQFHATQAAIAEQAFIFYAQQNALLVRVGKPRTHLPHNYFSHSANQQTLMNEAAAAASIAIAKQSLRNAMSVSVAAPTAEASPTEKLECDAKTLAMFLSKNGLGNVSKDEYDLRALQQRLSSQRVTTEIDNRNTTKIEQKFSSTDASGINLANVMQQLGTQDDSNSRSSSVETAAAKVLSNSPIQPESEEDDAEFIKKLKDEMYQSLLATFKTKVFATVETQKTEDSEEEENDDTIVYNHSLVSKIFD